MNPKILLVDNVSEFLEVQARLLEQEGYVVSIASSIADAEYLLKQDWFHLVVIDQRMEDDDNEHDISGLVLAQKREFAAVSKIILTAYPDYESAVNALGTVKGYPSAFDYIAKQKGPKVLSDAIANFFSHRISINWKLAIDWKAADAFSLVRKFETDLEDQHLLNRAEEFEDLFRRLFYEKDHIRIERLLWRQDGRVALIVFAFKEGMHPESHVVVCGQSKIINEEAERFKEFAPKAPGGNGTNLGEKMRAETTHFAANAYTLADNDLENVQTLAELYRIGPERIFNTALSNLYQTTLAAWHQGKLISEAKSNFEVLNRERLSLLTVLTRENLEERVNVIETQIPRLRATIERLEGKLTIHFNTNSYTYPDPSSFSSQLIETKQPASLISVPGTLSGDNILADATGRTWLTDFAEAGLAPQFWNFVSLEAAIRYDWVDNSDLLRRHEMENALVNTDFAKPDTRGLESVVSKPARAIVAIRKLSAREVSRDTRNYHLGIFFHAARRLADFNPTQPLTSNELARVGHILLSMAMMAEKLEENALREQPFALTTMEKINGVDEKARKVLIGNREIRLAPQRFEVFLHLYRHANEVCTKEEILEIALEGKFEENYLPTLIKRIREEIEDDPKRPRFLITEPNAGYRLILDPK
jgi:DNA-binding response OmpR family regulator